MTQAVIVADSTADVPQEMVKEYGIHIVPMRLSFGDQSYVEGVDITVEEFYDKLTKSRDLPTTSQTSPSQYVDIYRDLMQKYPGSPIISIHISSGMSGTYQSALLAKTMLEEDLGVDVDITVIDSLCATYGFGLQVVLAARLARDGASAEEIRNEVERVGQSRRLYFLVDTLEYLQKGGRIRNAAAIIGTLLNIKPILSVDEEGVIYPVDKMRGRKKAVSRVIELFKNDFGDHKDINVAVCDAVNPEGAEEIIQLLSQHFTLHEVVRTSIGAVVGTHVGPGTVATFVWPA
ncbi:DegV family protein with EDD domain [Fontibacillus solani]|uniref:EDD domain protein, DegV family n=2 Tax=Fontibacillus TaxID=995014 RepID=A0A1G7I776_9BACL|nr:MULTISPECIES: DegV family protein [Fontibacillus]MBA9086682.1 DegV family protein with EDD domain [Fontibacillus solani]SDF08209.1 EDD domain protein, DegV family [Fontibacillus panacisegetis]